MKNEIYDTITNGYIPRGLPGGFFIYEAENNEKITFAGPNVISLFGCDNMEDFLEYTGGTFKGMVHPEDYTRIENEIRAQNVFGEKKHDYVRYRIITKQGTERYIEDFGHLLHSTNGNKYYYVYVVDVNRKEYYNDFNNSLAEAHILTASTETDNLTGLLTMPAFYQQTQKFIDAHAENSDGIAVIHFDISNFKLFNERNGFAKGDELLCDLALALKEAFINDKYISRFSDDHFAVCTTGNRASVVQRVEKVYRTMLIPKEVEKKIRVKAGIYYLEDERENVGIAFDRARLACNSIKNRHDVNYCVYDEILRENMHRRQYVIDHIEDAIDKDYIKVFYQPVIDVATGKICSYEALVRWQDPSMGMLSPGEFIDTLEQFHLIHILDAHVIRKVCQEIVDLKNAGKELVPISINISRLDFELCDIFGMVESTRRKYDIPRNMLDLEITESALNRDINYIKAECDKMRGLGYHIWIDDFGSGYSSLNTIAEYNFDVLKLDLVFLRSLVRNSRTGKLMAYIVKGTKAMGVSPLCEGVETQEQFDFIKEIGCEKAQGYFFGKPLPMNESRKISAENGMSWQHYVF